MADILDSLYPSLRYCYVNVDSSDFLSIPVPIRIVFLSNWMAT